MNSLKTSLPLSMQIAEIIRKKINNGDLKRGHRLKSIRAMATEFSVGRQVIVSAFDILTKENILKKKPGCGVFINPKLKLENKTLRIGFYINEYDFSKRFHSNLLTLLNTKAETLTCEIISGTSKNNPDPKKWVKQKKIDGVLLSGKIDDSIAIIFNSLDIPFVVVGNYKLTEEVDTVEIDYSSVVEKVFAEVIAKHKIKTFGMISGSAKEFVNIQTANRIKKVIADNNLNDIKDYFYLDEEENGYKAMEFFMAKKHALPDVLFISSEAFWGAAKFLISHGLNSSDKRPIIIGESNVQKAFHELLDVVLYCPGKNLADISLERILVILKSSAPQKRQRKKIETQYAFSDNFAKQ